MKPQKLSEAPEQAPKRLQKQRAARARRIERARTALEAVCDYPDEWRQVMEGFCPHCGGPPDCQCWNEV